MIYTDNTKKAMKICFKLHKEQVDKSGLPYVLHPIHLAEQMTDENSCIVALLHDTVEDTDYTIEEIRTEFGDEIADAITLLTHESSVDYIDYVGKIKKNPLAAKVKIADLIHNSTLSRLNEITEMDIKRVKKYEEAIKLLQD